MFSNIWDGFQLWSSEFRIISENFPLVMWQVIIPFSYMILIYIISLTRGYSSSKLSPTELRRAVQILAWNGAGSNSSTMIHFLLGAWWERLGGPDISHSYATVCRLCRKPARWFAIFNMELCFHFLYPNSQLAIFFPFAILGGGEGICQLCRPFGGRGIFCYLRYHFAGLPGKMDGQ